MSNLLTPEKANVPPNHENHFKSQRDFYFGKEGFRAVVDLHDFKPDEIKVKTVGRYIIVDASHDERSDSFSIITRSYQRKFFLPDEFDVATVNSTVSSDGVLFLSATSNQPKSERIVPIQNLK